VIETAPYLCIYDGGTRISMFREKFRERLCFNRIRILKYRSFMRVNFSNGIIRNEDHIN